MAKVRVAAFDLDGTVLDGESPFILTKRLFRDRTLKVPTAARMGIWGLKYRLHLPQREALPRELLFSSLMDKPVEIIDDLIMDVYRARVSQRIRPGARREIANLKEAGLVPILASASFKPMTTAIVEELGFAGEVSTVMEERDGHYTAQVEGEPVQGNEKLRRLREYCDKRFGKGKWVLERAYSDHYSDIPLLEAAKEAFLIDPDHKLRKKAKERGWRTVDWDDPKPSRHERKKAEGTA
jgi:HAD superfamily hydrolase (TIGR01490 family)